MSGKTNSASPIHEKMCVAGTTILGGAVGSFGAPVVGTVIGSAFGFVIGVLICSRDIISKPIQDKLDFERALSSVWENPELQQKIIGKMVDMGISNDQKSAAIMLRTILMSARSNPEQYFSNFGTTSSGPAVGGAAHGLSDLSRKAAGITS